MNNILRAVLQKLTPYSKDDINTLDPKKIQQGNYEHGITICSKTSNTHNNLQASLLRRNEWTDTDLAIPTINNIHVNAELHIKSRALMQEKDKDLAFYKRAHDYAMSQGAAPNTHALAQQISQKIESLMRDIHEMESIHQLHKANQHANYWYNGHPYHIKHYPNKHGQNPHNKHQVYGSTTITQLTACGNRPAFMLQCQNSCYLQSNDPLAPHWILEIIEGEKRRHLGKDFTHIDAINILWECMFDGGDIDTLKQEPNQQRLSQHAYIHALRTIEQRPRRYVAIMEQLANYAT